MNFAGKSPVGNGNDSGRRYPRSQDTYASKGSNMTPNETRQTHNYKYLVADELQKLRNSSHHQQDEDDDIMDTEEEHNDIIKGLLYPGIENDDDEDDDIDDFFEEDYQMAQAAVAPSVARGVRGIIPSPAQMMQIDSRNNSVDATDSQRSRHRLRLGNEFADLVGEKLRR